MINEIPENIQTQLVTRNGKNFEIFCKMLNEEMLLYIIDNCDFLTFEKMMTVHEVYQAKLE